MGLIRHHHPQRKRVKGIARSRDVEQIAAQYPVGVNRQIVKAHLISGPGRRSRYFNAVVLAAHIKHADHIGGLQLLGEGGLAFGGLGRVAIEVYPHHRRGVALDLGNNIGHHLIREGPAVDLQVGLGHFYQQQSRIWIRLGL